MIITPLPRHKVTLFGNLVCLFKHTHTHTEINYHVGKNFNSVTKKDKRCKQKSLTALHFLKNLISKEREVFLGNGRR